MKITVMNKTFYLDFIHVGHDVMTGPVLIEFGLKKNQLVRYTEAVIRDENNIELARGQARCHPGDTFQKNVGRRVALEKCLEDAPIRMVHGLQGGCLLTKDCRKIRKQVWQEYLRKANI